MMKGNDDMASLKKLPAPALGLFLATALPAAAQTRERSQIPEQYKWDLKPLYPTDADWRAAKDTLAKRIPEIAPFEGTLGKSPQQLLKGLELMSELWRQYGRIRSYANLSSDQDSRDSARLAMSQETQQMATDLSAAFAFVEPEILELDKSVVERFLREEPKLGIYEQYLDDLLRRKAHTGTAGEERILAAAGLMYDAPESIYSLLSNADFPYPEVTLADGRKVKLDQAAFGLERATSVRADRKLVFDTFFGALSSYQRTFGASLYAGVKSHIFLTKARKYGSTLEAALDSANIPVSVYHSLVEGVRRNLPSLHRYLKLRQRMLGVAELHYYDLYAPLVKEVDTRYSVEEAQKLVLASLKPLGSEYQSVIEQSFRERWLDFYPNEGKVSGAYSNGSAYDVHPYMLLNYNGKYDDVSTLTHELGHTMQSYLSNKTQPFPTADYPIFVAEVASTFNEALLNDYMLKTVKDPDQRLSLLGSYLEGIKGTVFRQTQFAEFELRIHELAESGEALTGDALDALYLKIAREYYGHDLGTCIVDDVVKIEWAYIPHFYYNYYVYQYATSFTASAALSEQVLAGDPGAVKRMLTFLSAGSSDYSIELLKKAGVDMTTTAPMDLTMQKMNRVMDEMEKLLDARDKR